MCMELKSCLSRKLAVRLLSALIGVSLSGLSACTSAKVSTGPDNSLECEELVASIENLPDGVLVGTDIISAASFKDSSANLTGKYQGELGGATVSAAVDSEAVTRRFQEPGTTPDERSFKPTCVSGPYLFADGLVARRISEGLLLLEQDPDVGGIPSNLWLLLDPQ